MNNEQIKRDAIINSAMQQLRNLLESRYQQIKKSAEESFIEGDSQLVAKVAASIEWTELAETPRVAVRLSWSAKFKDESEAELDPFQVKLDLPEAAQ
jgi:DNA-binding transcriptional regulator YbjK